MAEHRVSMLSTSLRRFEDPARSSDPRIRSLVARLATIEPAPPPRAHFRAELRAQLVTVAPRLIAEGPAVESPRPAQHRAKPTPAAQAKPSRLGTFAGWTSRISIGRPLAAVTAVIAVFAMLLGGAVWVSKQSLPGDALYSLKRANENVALSLTTNDGDKGNQYLTLARTRAEEVSALVARTSSMAGGSGANAAGGVNAHTAQLIRSTLDSADADTRNGAKLLDAEAVRTNSADPLKSLTSWAASQLERLQGIADRLGMGALHDRVTDSAKVTAAAYSRAKALNADLGCKCLDKSTTDELGPMPCTVACSAAQDPAKQSTAPAKSPHTSKGGTAPSVTGSSGSASRSGATVPPETLPVNPSVSSVPVTTTGPKFTLPPLPSLTLPGQPTTTGGGGTHSCAFYVLGVCVG